MSLIQAVESDEYSTLDLVHRGSKSGGFHKQARLNVLVEQEGPVQDTCIGSIAALSLQIRSKSSTTQKSFEHPWKAFFFN